MKGLLTHILGTTIGVLIAAQIIYLVAERDIQIWGAKVQPGEVVGSWLQNLVSN